jgi:hypothetical protein
MPTYMKTEALVATPLRRLEDSVGVAEGSNTSAQKS